MELMTLDEAIQHCEDVIEGQYNLYDCYLQHGEQGDYVQNCLKCAEQHRQLTEWLKDYKRLLELEELLRQIHQTGDCNICKNKDCGYRPKPGQIVRYNCPFYKAENEG